MSRLVDLDKVLEIKDLSKKARAKIEKLEARPAIVSDSLGKHGLACVLLMAYRYAINRHITQCIIREDLDKAILDNIDLIPAEFVRQMIAGIHNEKRMSGYDIGKMYPLFYFGKVLDDYLEIINICLKDGKIKESQKLTEIIVDINKVKDKIYWAENNLCAELKSDYNCKEVKYLEPFLRELQTEYIKKTGREVPEDEYC